MATNGRRGRGRKLPTRGDVIASNRSIAVGGDMIGSKVYVGPDADDVIERIKETLSLRLNLTSFENQTYFVQKSESEVALLSAYRTDVVPLIGRDEIIADMLRWANDPMQCSVRVVSGRGGRGKTRLALELTKRLQEAKWDAGFAEPSELEKFRHPQQFGPWVWKTKTFVVVDYAAGRVHQLRAWIRELVNVLGSGKRPRLRILLLERHADRDSGWLPEVFGHGQADASIAAQSLLDPNAPFELPEIATIPARRQIFDSMRRSKRPQGRKRSFSSVHRFEEMQRRLVASLGDPLLLMMAGLAAIRAGDVETHTFNRIDLARATGRRELDRISDMAVTKSGHGASGLATLVRHMAVLITLCQGLSLKQVRELLAGEAAHLGVPIDAVASIEILKGALSVQGEDGILAPILPDIVGEAAIVIWMAKNGELAKLGIDALPSILRVGEFDAAGVSQVLVRIAQDFLSSNSKEPVAWLSEILKISANSHKTLMQIADALPGETVVMPALALDLTERIVKSLREDAEIAVAEGREVDQAELGNWLLTLSVRLGQEERNEDALRASLEAQGIFEKLVRASPSEALLFGLARSFRSASVDFTQLDRNEEALDASQKAVNVFRRLVRKNPDVEPELARALSNLSADLISLQRPQKALRPIREAIEILRRLPDAHLHSLANALSHLSDAMIALERRAEGIAAQTECVDIYRTLGDLRPDTYLVDFTTAADSLAGLLLGSNRIEESVVIVRELIRSYRILVQIKPQSYYPSLAEKLTDVVHDFEGVLTSGEVIAELSEAVSLYRELAQSKPELYRSDLARSLSHLGMAYTNIDEHKKALVASEEAVAIYQELAISEPDEYRYELSRVRTNIGSDYFVLERYKNAAKSFQLAANDLRELVKLDADIYLPDLADCLKGLEAALFKEGRLIAAIEASRKAASIWRGLVANEPEKYLSKYVSGLSSHFDNLNANEDVEEALLIAEEMVTVAPRLLELDFITGGSALADGRYMMAQLAMSGGSTDQAMLLCGESVEFLRYAVLEHPDEFRKSLVEIVGLQSDVFAALGRHSEAADAAIETLQGLVELAKYDPEIDAEFVADAVKCAERYCASAGRSPAKKLIARANKVIAKFKVAT